jgi:hypothetical protein
MVAHQSHTHLSKTRYVWGRQCGKRLWYGVHDPEPRIEPLPGSLLGVGIEVGVAARDLWPGGVLIDTRYDEYPEAIARTNALIADPAVPAIFEAALTCDGVLIRVDILERLPDDRWRLNEVKSSTKIKDEYLEEIALQAHVIVANYLELADIHLVYINKEFVRNGEIDLKKVFVSEDVTDNVIPLLSSVPRQIANMHAVLRLHQAPAVRPSRHCFQPYDCEFWQRCISDKPADWVFYIPRLSESSFDRLELAGVESMQDVPANFRLTPTQKRVVDVAKSGKLFRSSTLTKALAALAPPVSYLDFETFNPAIPLYPGTSPYQRIPFQWSLHHDDGGGVLCHAEFLADGDTDPRREFAETLLAAVERLPGPITVWSSFEASVIRELAASLPNSADRLTAVLARIVDLLLITRDHVYHPEFRGSYSLKSVVPAVAADLSYGDLDITEGGDASAAFYRIVADPSLTAEKRAGLRRSLLTYCERDTLALARVHQWLKSND